MDYFSKKITVTLEINEAERFIKGVDELKKLEKLSVIIKPFRKKRSLSANAYFHVLVTKIAEKVGTSKAEVSGNAKVRGNADYTLVQGFGTKFRCTTFYRGKNKKIMVNCGCFHGDLEGFRKQVKETRSGKIAKEYLMIADLMEYHFTSEDSSDE